MAASIMSASTTPKRTSGRIRWIGWLLVALTAYALSGVRHLDEARFGVLDGPLAGSGARQVQGRWAWAPAGLLRLTLYPRTGVELALPQAEEAMIAAPDGSRFGFRGWVTLRVREQEWEALHRAADGRGIRGALTSAIHAAAESFRPRGRQDAIPATARRELERGLTEALAARGIELRRLELDSVDYLAGVSGESPVTDTRLLILGLDGADWEIIDALVAQGRMPNLSGLLDAGSRGKLLSISPMLSPVIWTTVATGVEPSRHGVLDFLVEDPASGARQPVTSAQRLVPTFWEMLSHNGTEVGVTAWWATWPADPVRGYLISDRIAYQLFDFEADPEETQGKSWPPGLYEEIRPLVVTPESIGWDQIEPFLSGERRREEQFNAEERETLDEFRTLLASGQTYLAIAKQLRERFEPRLEIAYFEGTDTIGHLFMPYRLPELPGVDAESIRSFSAIVDRYYELADDYLGQLLEDREGWTIMVLSDHGFASDATRPRSTDSRIGHGAAADWHRRFGILLLAGENVRPNVRIDESSVYDIAPTVLSLFGQPVPRSWPGKVLGQALTEEFLEANPVRYAMEDPDRRVRQTQGSIDPADADLLEKLQSLGYVSSGGEGSESITARNNAGVSMLAEGHYAEAEEEFRRGMEANPGAPMLLVNLALALRFQGRPEEAEPLLLRALEHTTTQRMAGHMLAQIQLDRGELESAESMARRVLELEPDASEVRNTLGLILEKSGDLEGAQEAFELAVRLDPDAAMARSNLGNLAKRRGELPEAEQWYLRAIEADPYFMGAYNNLALVYQAQGQMQKAIDLYELALVKSQDNAVVLNNLGSLYYATQDFAGARGLWRRSALADPTYPSPLNNLASLEINAQRLAEAEGLLERALTLDPGYGDARINLSLVYRSRSEWEAAREQLRQSTQDPRTGANGWVQLGLFELERGMVEAAIDALESGRPLAPRDINLLNALGEAHYRMGRQDRAGEIWRESLALNPDQPRLQQLLNPKP